MYNELLKVENFSQFTSSWGAKCKPCKIGDFYYLPLGWEEELTKRGKTFTVVNVDKSLIDLINIENNK
jgi:hypothetical protein